MGDATIPESVELFAERFNPLAPNKPDPIIFGIFSAALAKMLKNFWLWSSLSIRSL